MKAKRDHEDTRDSEPNGGLNDSHKRQLLLTLEHVDTLLKDAFQDLNSADMPSPFQRYIPDSLPVQRKVMADYLSRLRGLMVDVLSRHEMPLPSPTVSSVWAFRVALMSVKDAITELRPKYMRGYGQLSADAAHDLEVLVTELDNAIIQMDAYLAGGAGKDLRERLRRLEMVSDERTWLSLLEDVITSHGLVELRPSLDVLIERLESGDLEVAVFGRVSSGKSSLLNHILGADVLPVGVTPVTAVPTRVSYGSTARACIAFAERQTINVDLAEIASYATEQANPDNAKHVVRIRVELPIEKLKGVTFVDTPGLGSVSRNGELESLAYLPRCDIGIMLIDASSTLTPEDGAVIHALYQAGADVMVLLNKADMLTSEERAAAHQYVGDRLKADVGQEALVSLTSIKGPDSALCDQWFNTVLVPKLHEHNEIARSSIRRKTGLLREAAVTALRRRLGQPSVSGADPVKRKAVVQELRDGLASFELALRDGFDLRGTSFVKPVLDAVVQTLLSSKPLFGGRPQDSIVEVAQRYANQVAVAMAKDIDDLREKLLRALRHAGDAFGGQFQDKDDLPVPSAMPVPQFSLPSDMPLRQLAPWFADRWFGGLLLRQRLEKRLALWLTESFDRHLVYLRRWREESVTELRRAYAVAMDFYIAEETRSTEGTDKASLERDLERLLSPQPETGN